MARATILVSLLALLCLAAGRPARGQRLDFEHLTVEQGLSQATVRAICQDLRGFLWIGTQDGLNRYDGYGFEVYKHDAGDPGSLRSNTIFAIYEDSSGVLWVGAWEGGLHRYDRAADTFAYFRHRPEDAASLSHDTVRTILESRDGTLWVGTIGGGLNRLDSVETAATAGELAGRFTRYRHDPADPDGSDQPASCTRCSTKTFDGVSFPFHSIPFHSIPFHSSHDSVRVLYEDRSGALWVGTLDGGLNRFDGVAGDRASERFRRYRHDPADPTSLSSDSVGAILEDSGGSLWVGTWDGGLDRFDPVSDSFTNYRHDPQDPASLGGDRIWALHEHRPGVLWVATRGAGLSRFDVAAGTALRFRHDPEDSTSLASDLLTVLYEDPSGTLWLGTDGGGVDRLDLKPQKFPRYRHDPGDPTSLASDFVLSLSEDRDGDLWIGTWGGGLDRFDRRTGKFIHHRYDPNDPRSLASDVVYAVLIDSSGTLWCGTTGGGVNKLDRAGGGFSSYRQDPANPRSLSDDDVLTIYQDRRRRLWFGTWEGGVSRLDEDSADPTQATFTRFAHDPQDPASLSGNRVYAVHQDRHGALWVSAEAAGLNRLDDPATSSGTGFVRFRHDPRDPSSLSNNDVMAIYEDQAGTLWVGTYGGGLDRFDGVAGDRTTERFTRYDERQGLANNVVYGILEDDSGRLWLSTNQGLSRFDPQAETFRNYDVDDGLQGMEFNSGAFYRSARGVFYFGGNHGFNAFRPEDVTDNPYVPPVVLTSFKKLGEEAATAVAVPELTAITLGPEDRIVSFEFAALSYTVPHKNRYAYLLEGLHEDWIALGTKRDITLTSLNPGSYVFRVKGSNNDGVWNHEGLAVELTVLPPYWATWWFRTASVLALGLAAFTVYRLRTRRVQARNRQLEAMNRELEVKNRQLERFSYTVSHDLKTPLVTIKGFLGLLAKDIEAGQPERVQRDVERIGGAADKMARLLDELLELSRIGHMMKPAEPVPLTEVALEAAGLAAGKVEQHATVIDVQPSMPTVAGDRVRLLEMFQNLIDNAISYMGDQPRPRVEVRAKIDGRQVLCSVRDNGVGIDPEYHRKVFGLFERLSADQQGTGIGLTLVERIVEVHGGRVWVESEGEGQGATFYFTLPLSSAEFG